MKKHYSFIILFFLLFSFQFHQSQTTLLNQDFESESIGAIGTSSASPPYQLSLSSGCSGDGWIVSTTDSQYMNCVDCSGKRATITYETCSQDYLIYTDSFTPSQSEIAVSFAYDYRFWSSGDSFKVILFNSTTLSTAATLVDITASSTQNSYSNSSISVTPGHTYRLRFRYQGNDGYGAVVDNILVTEESADPTITVGSAISGLDYVSGSGPSASQTTTVSGANLEADITITAPTNFEISTDDSSFSDSLTLSEDSGTVGTTDIYVRLKSGLAGFHSGNITVTSTNATSQTISISGAVTVSSTNTFYVSSDGADSNDGLSWNNAFLTLEAAVAVSAAGSTINIDKGTFANDSEININKSLTIQGQSREETIFDGTSSAADDGFLIITADNVTVKNMTIQDYSLNQDHADDEEYEGGAGIRIGAVRSADSAPSEITGLLIKNIKFFNNSSPDIHGAAIYFVKNLNASNHDVDIEECLFYDNTASRGPVAYAYDGVTADWKNCVMVDNKAESWGAVLYHKDEVSTGLDGVMNFYNCTMWRNLSQNEPGTNSAIRPWVGGSGTHVTHSVYNSIVMYTLQADANWNIIGYGEDEVHNDINTSNPSDVTINIYDSYVTRLNYSNIDNSSNVYDFPVWNGDAGTSSHYPSDTSGFGTHKNFEPKLSDDHLVGKAGGSSTSIDVNGVTRPQGSGTDIGAYEYRNTWVGGTSTDWDTASNWSLNQVPSTTSAYDSPRIADVSSGSANNPIIAPDPNGDEDDFTIDNLQIDNGGNLTIGLKGSLKLTGNLVNNGTFTMESNSENFSSLIVQGASDGQYVHLDDGTNNTKRSGNITYKRYVADEGADEWDYIGSPVLGQDLQNLIDNNSSLATNASLVAIGPFDNSAVGGDADTSNMYTYYNATGNSGTVISSGKGYVMATDEGSTSATVDFTGTISTKNISFTIDDASSINTNYGKFNLVSNPFPSFLNANAAADTNNNFLTVNGSNLHSAFAAVYAYNGDGTFATKTNANTVGTQLHIAPGQGFFVASDDENGNTITFTEAMQTNSGSDDFISGDNMDSNEVELKLFNGASEIESTEIFFIEGLTNGLDVTWDGGNFNAHAAIMTRLVEEDEGYGMAINAMGLDAMENAVIPLVINQSAGQEFRINLFTATIPDPNVYLEDVVEGTFTNLYEEDFVYTPTSDLEGVGRFFIHMTADTMSNEEVSTSMLNAYKEIDASYITIEGLATQTNETKVSLYNILGRKVLSTTLNNNMGTQTISTVGLSAGIYVIELESGTDRLTKKLLIQ